jgi:lantibiotic leader peptide-processing serine protease
MASTSSPTPTGRPRPPPEPPSRPPARAGRVADQAPFADKQWDMRMIDATPSGSYRVDQGRAGVLVGIIDSGIDGNHPDLRDNFNRRLSRNFAPTSR